MLQCIIKSLLQFFFNFKMFKTAEVMLCKKITFRLLGKKSVLHGEVFPLLHRSCETGSHYHHFQFFSCCVKAKKNCNSEYFKLVPVIYFLIFQFSNQDVFIPQDVPFIFFNKIPSTVNLDMQSFYVIIFSFINC